MIWDLDASGTSFSKSFANISTGVGLVSSLLTWCSSFERTETAVLTWTRTVLLLSPLASTSDTAHGLAR